MSKPPRRQELPKSGRAKADQTVRSQRWLGGCRQGLRPSRIREAIGQGPCGTQKSGSAIDGRTARGKGYAQSLKRRKMVEEAFGWIKTIGGPRKTRHKGLAKVAGQALFCFATYNLTRLLNLL